MPHLEASLRRRRTKPAVLFALGRVYARARRSARRSHSPSASATCPDGRPLWHQLRGLVLQRENRHEQALAAFEAAAALERRAAAALREHRREPPRARRPRRRAAGVRDGAAAVRARRRRPRLPGLDGRAGGAPGGRARHAEQAVALDEDLAEPRGLLGRILLKQGQSAAAGRASGARGCRRRLRMHRGASCSHRPISAAVRRRQPAGSSPRRAGSRNRRCCASAKVIRTFDLRADSRCGTARVSESVRAGGSGLRLQPPGTCQNGAASSRACKNCTWRLKPGLNLS